MKNKNQRELEKYWADQAAKKAKLAKKATPKVEPNAGAPEKAAKPVGKNEDENSAM